MLTYFFFPSVVFLFFLVFVVLLLFTQITQSLNTQGNSCNLNNGVFLCHM